MNIEICLCICYAINVFNHTVKYYLALTEDNSVRVYSGRYGGYLPLSKIESPGLYVDRNTINKK